MYQEEDLVVLADGRVVMIASVNGGGTYTCCDPADTSKFFNVKEKDIADKA